VALESRLNILLADRECVFREALGVALRAEPDLEVVAEMSDIDATFAEVRRTSPDVILLDADLTSHTLGETVSTLHECSSRSRVFVLAREPDHEVLTEALEAGASGYETKDTTLSELIDAVRLVGRGGFSVPGSMMSTLLTGLFRRRRAHDEALRRLSQLTRRERQVLALLARCGDTNRIANDLVISPETARTHIQNVLGKLGVHSRLEAAAFVLENGVLEDLIADGDNGRPLESQIKRAEANVSRGGL
jgi:two-component system, NarL family, nitrate/nitrite response regulator NarL